MIRFGFFYNLVVVLLIILLDLLLDTLGTVTAFMFVKQCLNPFIQVLALCGTAARFAPQPRIVAAT